MKYYAIGLFLLLTISVQAQRYTRNGISIIHVNYNDKYDKMVNDYFNDYKPEARYDNNLIDTKNITLITSREYSKTKEDGKHIYLIPERTNELSAYSDKLGKEILSYLLNYNKKDYMDPLLLSERGQYNANDDDMKSIAASKANRLTDGFNLISNSYAIIYDIANLRYEYRTDLGIKEGEYYWICTPVAYLYRLKKVDDETFVNNDCWINKEDSPEIKKSKSVRYKAMKVPMELIMKVSEENISESSGVEANKRAEKKNNEEELVKCSFFRMMNQVTSTLTEKTEKKNIGFQLSNSIYAMHPIQAKIGKKEGVKANERFFVYENTSSDGENFKEVRRGVVLASKKIANNEGIATGKTQSSVFYQIAGRKLHEGLTIREKKSMNMAIDAGYRYKDSYQGAYVGLTYSHVAGKATNHTGLANITIDKDAYNVALGYGYGLRVNNFELYPYLGGGLDTFNKDTDVSNNVNESEEKESMKRSAWYVLGGVRANLTIYYPVQIFAGCEGNYRVSESSEYEIFRKSKDRNIDGVNVYGGIRICF